MDFPVETRLRIDFERYAWLLEILVGWDRSEVTSLFRREKVGLNPEPCLCWIALLAEMNSNQWSNQVELVAQREAQNQDRLVSEMPCQVRR